MTTTGLVARGIVARQLATHRVLPRPGRTMSNCKLDGLGGNTMLGMHLAEIPPGGTKCDHRHLDETMAFMVAGRGRTEIRQDDGDLNRVEWTAGDLVVIPCNAWHRHVNVDKERPARQLSFRNTGFMYRVLFGDEGRYSRADPVYHQADARFRDRFADGPGYFTIRTDLGPGRVLTHFVRQVVDEPSGPLEAELGDRVSARVYAMGGQRTLEVVLVDMFAGGRSRPRRPLAEEAFVVLRGRGHTELASSGHEPLTVGWRAGDLVCPPLGVQRTHRAVDDARLLLVRHVGIERALGLGAEKPSFPVGVPDRFATITGPPRTDA